ncbi:hypothetical protein SUDANB171_03657 [Streptomyces sp. enrichment culture]|uniref:hypothetical protein n=1 Tax=Streptomyces sp. enrichment culture TaxID=1795815 RepID=UPI003F55C464
MTTGDPSIIPDISHATVLRIVEIRDLDNAVAAVQVVFSDRTALVCTVWTDWSLALKEEAHTDLPSYFWPPGDYSRARIDVCLSTEESPVILRRPLFDEVGTLVGIDIAGEEFTVSVESSGGELRARVSE